MEKKITSEKFPILFEFLKEEAIEQAKESLTEEKAFLSEEEYKLALKNEIKVRFDILEKPYLYI